MSFEKLSQEDERKTIKFVDKMINYTRMGLSPDDAMVKVASEIPLNPNLLFRAGEAYNRSKSIYYLKNTPSSCRHESFPLVNMEKVAERIFGAAADKTSPPPPLAIPKLDFSTKGLEVFDKVAFDKASDLKTLQSVSNRSSIEARESARALIEKLASDIRQLRLKSEMSLNKACDKLARMRNAELEKVARLMCNRYGQDGAALMQIAFLKSGKDAPIKKTAEYAVLPNEEPYLSLVDAMDSALAYKAATLAARSLNKTAAKELGPVRTGLLQGTAAVLTTGRKTLASATELSKPVFDVFKEPVKQELAASSSEGIKEYQKVFTPEFLSKLKAMDAEENFIDVASSPYLANYPIEDVAAAYNSVVATMPVLQKPRYKPWLVTFIRRHLAQGGQFDPHQIVEMGQLMRGMAELDKSERDVRKDERVVRQALAEHTTAPALILTI